MYKDIYENWIKSKKLSKKDIEELSSIKNDDSEIQYRFGKNLEFGTAGMRGIIGLGTNMINSYTVRLATQGLADFIKSIGKNSSKRGVVISYDTRKFSEDFAFSAATVLASNKIKCYLFSEVHPVPMLSFAIRQLHTIAGIMITASHNPKEYNGYKVYGEDGAQMSPVDTAKVVEFIDKIDDPLSDKILYNESNSKKIIVPSKRLDSIYYKKIKKLCLSSEAVKAVGKNVKIVYTPVHGSGYIPVTTIFKKLGINAIVVPEQANKDPEFTTVKVPNPEYKETLDRAIKMADFKDCDVVIGTDPDCDRMAAAIRNDENKFMVLSGNQTGILLLDYVLARMKEKNKLSARSFIVKSFVTTSMAKLIADYYKIELIEVPVGFKYIGEKIKLLDDTGRRKFVFGFEESCGYLRGTHARDKDGVVASMLFAEMVCYYTYKKISVYQKLNELYSKYGYVLDKNESVAYDGLFAMKEMNDFIDKMKYVNIDSLGGINIIAKRDYSTLLKTNKDGTQNKIDCEPTNALYYELEGGGFVCLRPSGTEPKLKIYYSIKADTKTKAEMLLRKIKSDFEKYYN